MSFVLKYMFIVTLFKINSDNSTHNLLILLHWQDSSTVSHILHLSFFVILIDFR